MAYCKYVDLIGSIVIVYLLSVDVRHGVLRIRGPDWFSCYCLMRIRESDWLKRHSLFAY